MNSTPVKVSFTMLPRNMFTGCGVRNRLAYPDTSFSTDHVMPSGDGSGVEVLKTITPPMVSQPSRSNCRPLTAPSMRSTTLAHGPGQAAGGVWALTKTLKSANPWSTICSVHDLVGGLATGGPAVRGLSQLVPNSAGGVAAALPNTSTATSATSTEIRLICRLPGSITIVYSD